MKVLVRFESWLAYLALVLYVVSLFLPGIFASFGVAPNYEIDAYKGYQLLEIGWFGALSGIFAWYANPLALLAFIFAKSEEYKLGLRCSIGAFILGLQTFIISALPVNFGNMAARDANVNTPIDHVGIGTYIWLSSFAVLALYCYLNTMRAR